MKTKQVFLAVLLCVVLPAMNVVSQTAKTVPVQLSVALSSGNVTLTARGDNYSSGMGAVVGTLRNNTSVELNINVSITEGLYLRNTGAGQNMVATGVFLKGGRFSRIGANRFIKVSAGANVEIEIEAFCADMDRANPASTESFSTEAIPSAIVAISSSISRYIADNFELDLTLPVQIAVWRTQGHSQAEISAKLSFTGADWEIATTIINY